MHTGFFRGSRRYAELTGRTGGTVREPRAAEYGFPYSERHLRCVWFDPAFRPPVLHTHAGEEVVVENPGRWNLEAGPDFYEATLRVGPERRRLCGDVELHLRAAGWKTHGHVGDPRYARVIAHVTYFPGAVGAEHLPAGAVEVALKSDLAANPFFSFESLDVTAYPYAARAPKTPCAELLAGAPDRLAAVLESAGEERLRIKAERLALAVAERGIEQTLYEEILCALGYKNNRVPFRHLARKVTLEALRAECAGDARRAYSLLLGVAGLLPAKLSPSWDEETREFVRRLWDIWWKQRSGWESAVMPRSAWVLAGQRPQNHPLRRLMAAAALFSRETGLADRIRDAGRPTPEAWLGEVSAMLQPADPTGYWDRRTGLAGRPQKSATALVGPGRVAAMLSNVVLPFAAAAAARSRLPPGDALLRALPPEEDNALVAQTAHALLGRDHNPALYRTALRQQGLLQVFHDFCLNDRSHCESCPFPEALRAG